MNKHVNFFYLLLLLCPVQVHAGHIFLHLSKNYSSKATPFQHALAELYVQNPQLLHTPHEIDIADIDYALPFDTKNLTSYGAKLIPILYFCYESYKNYKNYQHKNENIEKSFINQKIAALFPKLFINAPRHINFFLEEVEILLQAYLLKILLKMIIFCFFA